MHANMQQTHVLTAGKKGNTITSSVMMTTERNVPRCFMSDRRTTRMQEEDGCGEAAVHQSMSSFLCVTDAPNDIINHDIEPFEGI